jgi:putative heme-binding domain-containing protein
VSLTDSEKGIVMALLGRQEDRMDADLALITPMLAPQTDAEMQRLAVRMLVRWNQPQARAALFKRWNEYAPDLRFTLVDTLVSTPEGATALLREIQNGTLPAIHISPAHRQQLSKHSDKALAATAGEVFAVKAAAERQQGMAAFRPALTLVGRAGQGEAHFQLRCAACHGLEETGRLIGPDLRSITDRSDESLWIAILDPNRNVEPKFLGYTATLDTGESVNGLIVSETGNSVIMRGLDGVEREVLRRSIVSLASSQLSFMPEGLEAGMTPQDLADLMAFVRAMPGAEGK